MQEEPTGERAIRPPPLPPSPLTRVVEAVPFERLPLLWTTPLYALLGSLVAGLLLVPAFLRVHHDAYVTGGAAAVVAGMRAAVLALGAVLADRVLPSWPRMARWALGASLLGLVPGLEFAGAARGPALLWVMRWWPWVVAAAVRDGLVGATGGWLLLREWDVPWARSLGAVVVWGVYLVGDLVLSGPFAGFGSGTERLQATLTVGLAGSLLPSVLALCVWLAWRRALDDGVLEGE